MLQSALESPASPIAVRDAERLARTLYGVDAHARRLAGEHDDTFHVAAGGGAEYVIKVMHPARERAFVEMQVAALDHLAGRAPALPVPRVASTLDGARISVAPVAGDARLVWMLGWLPGTPLAGARPRPPALLQELGAVLGTLDAALAGFSHPAAYRELRWDLARAGWIRDHVDRFASPARRALASRVVARWEADVAPTLPALRRAVIHGDANDHNVLVDGARGRPRSVSGLVDFGDMVHTVLVADVAIAAAYALTGTRDPLDAAAAVVRGYHGILPLEEREIAILWPLIAMRLAVSVTTSALRTAARPGDDYATVSEAAAWDGLERMDTVHPRLAHYALRDACGLPAVPHTERVARWLREAAPGMAPLLDLDPRTTPSVVLDFGVGSTMLGADPAALETGALASIVGREMQRAGAAVGVGRWNEARPIYTGTAFPPGARPTDEARTVHIGLDLFVPPGTGVRAPLAGTVRCAGDNATRKDYGPVVILEHETDDGTHFHTLYGHLARTSLAGLAPGRRIARGERFAEVGAPPENGDWVPHLHLQLITDLLELDRDYPGVAAASRRAVWTSLSPDPTLLAGVPDACVPPPAPSKAALHDARRRLTGANLSLSFAEPLEIVRGWMQYLYDETGRAYLDAYNNVPLVGHSHPRVVGAVQRQMALLNTNTRYLHPAFVQYAERLGALMPDPLKVCWFLNSASEANELALRLARAYTGRRDVIVLEHAYHGHTSTLIEISPYKFDGPGGTGRQPWVHVAPIPDDYRGPYRRDDPDAGRKYASHVGDLAARAAADGHGIAAFIAETLPSVGGQIVFPAGYLTEAYRHVRAAGGVCIADEVQVGFGRLGRHRWGFEMQGVVPDIVVLGKPIGNGFPLAGVVTNAAIAASFDTGMEFFSTFGGNPVACAAGLAVLDVLRDEDLQENARRVGAYLRGRLEALMPVHPVVGDVRGAGLFLGVELVRDRETREPAADEAAYVVNRMREEGVLTGTDGPWHNVLKLRPPLVFSEADADLLVEVMDVVLGEDPVRG